MPCSVSVGWEKPGKAEEGAGMSSWLLIQVPWARHAVGGRRSSQSDPSLQMRRLRPREGK